MKPSVVLNKMVGETPLACLQAYKNKHPELENVPMAYAGRLDPMASGKLLILQGEECKRQEKYHHLDKEYIVEILFGVSSDTADVLGILKECDTYMLKERKEITKILKSLRGTIELPYPHFSSKTVRGKPLHTWMLEGRIDEIDIPIKRSEIYALKLRSLRMVTAKQVYEYATRKIEMIPKVTQESKALGNDFRRDDVRKSWKEFLEVNKDKKYQIATIRCVCTSGTYMRTLSEVIATSLHTCGLAYSIHRTKIGTFKKAKVFGMWTQKF